MHTCALSCYKMMHCGIFDTMWCLRDGSSFSKIQKTPHNYVPVGARRVCSKFHDDLVTWKRFSYYWPSNRRCMLTSSNGNIFRVTGHLWGEFTCLRWIPRTKASDAELSCFFYLRLNKRVSKQWWGWWFETLSRPLWRHCNGDTIPQSASNAVLWWFRWCSPE